MAAIDHLSWQERPKLLQNKILITRKMDASGNVWNATGMEDLKRPYCWIERTKIAVFTKIILISLAFSTR